MEKKTLRQLKKGELFKRSENGVVYVRGDYAGEGKYSCCKFDDCNEELFINGLKFVFIGFEF